MKPPPPVWKEARLYASTCFEEEPGLTICVYATNPNLPQPCVFLVSLAACGHPLWNGGEWFEVYKECQAPQPKTFEEEQNEWGL